MIADDTYKVFKERVRAVLNENGELEKPDTYAGENLLIIFKSGLRSPKRKITLDTVSSFARAYNVSADYLLGLDNEMY